MGKVLVIDDEPFILMMLEDKLKRSGFAVVTSRESVNALELVRKERPDLIVLDWMMPEISGIEICRQLKADPELSSIPVFMLTAKGQEEDEKKGMKTGANRYITKPFSPKALVEIIEKELKDRNIS
jgi:two-component system phosphate regulon response regulator PhoB